MKTFFEWLNLESNLSLKGPSGSPVKYFFKTAQGSMYILTENGESRRIKSVHANTGGEDAGLHGWNQKCVFVPPEDQVKGNSMQYLRNNYDGPVMLSVLKPKTLTFLMIKNNQWSPVLFKDAYIKSAQDPKFQNKSEEPMEFKYLKEPTMGFNVCEWNEKGNKLISGYHFGSEVSEIKDINDVDPKILSGFMNDKTQPNSQQQQQQQTNQQQPNAAQTTSQEDTLPQWLEKNFGIQTTDAEIKKFPALNKIGIRNRKKDSPGYGSMTYYDKSNPNQYKDFINQLKTSFGL
jgi:hypothetical protein